MNQEQKEALVGQRIAALNTTLNFRQFLGASLQPMISDAEIIVSFIDVRGFTKYCRCLQQEMQDRKIQNFLRTYLKIFNEGLMAWHVKHLQPEYGPVNAVTASIATHIIPKMYKNLGDGMMIVWEVPSGLPLDAQGVLAQHVVWIVEEISHRFYRHFRDLSPVELDSYSAEVEKLDLGCGIAKGHAWRLDYGHSLDYAGSIINLASRLEGHARPRGIIAHYDVSTWMFDRLVKRGAGRLVMLRNIKGYGNVKAWCSLHVGRTAK